ncbi:YheC/YheD family protein [Paenibacillus sp. YYML68]|uniref:YheC/YheD family endospore coat-associated protein n=1 Tax=Paenibacillus sp. YYML68 TaxID=2909250 RepID=UPI00249107F4|nr:YheC/YheD family protein [Paenibacillus sp. YYML68]
MSKPLGVLAMYLEGRRLEELAFFKKLCIQGRKLGLDVMIFTPDDVKELQPPRVHALTYDSAQQKWVRKWTKFPPLIYDRCRYHGVSNYRKLSGFRKRHPELQYISRPLANKWAMHQLLAQDDRIEPYLPATVRYRSAKELADFLKKHEVVYMKPKSGTGGRGILRLQRLAGSGSVIHVQGRDPMRRILTAGKMKTDRLPAKLEGWKLQEQYIVQQGINLKLRDGRVHDFRMLVQKDGQGQWQVTGCAGRIGPQRSVTSNLHGGGRAVSMETLLARRFGTGAKVESIRKEAYELGLRVAEHLETKFGPFCEAGIDLAVDPSGHIWLLEVNPKPSREVFRRIGEKETYAKAITRPLQYAQWLMTTKKKDAPVKPRP